MARSSDWITENPFHAKRQRVYRAIKSAGKDGLAQWQVSQLTKHLPNCDRKEILDSLAETGDVRTLTVETTGRPRTVDIAA